jgi:hypothetical protein
MSARRFPPPGLSRTLARLCRARLRPILLRFVDMARLLADVRRLAKSAAWSRYSTAKRVVSSTVKREQVRLHPSPTTHPSAIIACLTRINAADLQNAIGSTSASLFPLCCVLPLKGPLSGPRELRSLTLVYDELIPQAAICFQWREA